MKFMDILKEEFIPITDKQRDKARKVYKALKVGVYKAFKDADFYYKYVLPDFNDQIVSNFTEEGKIYVAVNLNDIDMYMIEPKGDYFLKHGKHLKLPNSLKTPDHMSEFGPWVALLKKMKTVFLSAGVVMVIN
jgi:hypothetical protein